ncbi:MAG: Rieske 2Fe-2S domain-containing protein [Prochloraceae cyanobacterium]|nr:Rieske 2Fe-2S domain-containing protein [Prochloraceae cyanobacterium]
MTLTSNKPETTPVSEAQQEFNWRNCWYPVTFTQDLPKNLPYGFTLYDEPIVLFRNSEGKLVCLRDLCPHRAAKLSDGQIIDGQIECLYHGWQFGSEGECLHIPQLPEDAKIPANSCVQSYRVVECQGTIWMWAGDPESADEKSIPIVTDLETPGLVIIDTVTDLPYDPTYLVENLLDPAHVPISHDRTELRARREDARPLEMEILSVSARGIEARYRSNIKPNNVNWLDLEFIAPCLVHYIFAKGVPSIVGGLALYAIPLGQGRSRILIRRYGNFFSWSFKSKPRWLEHLRQNKILEEDLFLILGQEKYIKQSGKSLKKAYLPLNTSDMFLMEYHKWVDKFAPDLPCYQGYSTSKGNENHRLEKVPLDRFSRHTKICSSCNRAYKVTNRVKQISIGLAIALFATATLADNSTIKIVAVSISLLAIVTAIVTQIIKTKFEVSYTRH